MAADNHTTIVGNLVEDPELRFTNNGIAVTNLRVAVTKGSSRTAKWRDGDTSFLKVNVWRGQAEHLADSLAKGDRVMVTGRLRQRSWETPEGDKRSVTEIEADEVGASLKWATAKVERTSQRGNGDRAQGRERQAERGGDFNDPPVLSNYSFSALGSARGAELLGGTERIRRDVILIRHIRGMRSSWSSEGRPAYGASEIDRGCPAGTGIDPAMWHASGTAGDGDLGLGLVVSDRLGAWAPTLALTGARARP
jgi:single-strand DNA-binding protein